MALFLLLTACCSTCPNWDFKEAITCCPDFNSGKLCLYPQNEFRGAELEIARGSSGLNMYLNIYCLSFPRDPQCPSMTPVSITCDDVTYTVLAHRFEGGQRLLLPSDTTHNIIYRLLECKTLMITVGRFQAEIVPEGFYSQYSKLMKIPI